MKTLQFKTLIIIALIATSFSSCTKSSDIDYPTLKQVYFAENFDNTGGTALPAGWNSYAEMGTRLWSGGVYAGDGYATVTAYGSGDAANISWLISPAIDMDQHEGESLSFQTCHDKYVTSTSNSLEVYVSKDYNGNFGASHWTKISYNSTLPYPFTSSYAYVNSGKIDLSYYTGTLHFAFKYTGINPSTGAYQVDNVKIVY
jgi:hypothetical protein